MGRAGQMGARVKHHSYRSAFNVRGKLKNVFTILRDKNRYQYLMKSVVKATVRIRRTL